MSSATESPQSSIFLVDLGDAGQMSPFRLQPIHSLGSNENTAHSNPLRLHLSDSALSEVIPSAALQSLSLVDQDVNATKSAPSHVPHPVPQETTNTIDPIFVVDLGVDRPIDLLLNYGSSYHRDDSVHSKMNNIASEPSLDPEELDRPPPGSLQRASRSRSSNPLPATLPLPSPSSNNSPSSLNRATGVHAGQQGLTAVTPACTKTTTSSSTSSQSITSLPYPLGLRQQSKDVISFANETVKDRCKHPNPPPTRYPQEYKSIDTIRTLNTPKSPYDNSPLIFCPELPTVIPPYFASDVQHDTPPIFCPELPLVLFPDPPSDPPCDSRPDPPSNSDLDPQPIFIPELPRVLFPDPQTASHPIFSPDLGDGRAPNFTFSQSLIGRLAKSEEARSLRTTKDSPSEELPLGLIPVNNGVPELVRSPKLSRNDQSRELTPIFTFDLSDSHLLNAFGDHLPVSFAISPADGGRNVDLRSIGGDPVIQTPTAFNEHEMHSGFKLCRSPTTDCNPDYAMSSTSPHWSGRWEMFPLRLVTFGQTQSVHERILSKARNDMDWDEMNLNWLTEELLSQSFPLPDFEFPPPSTNDLFSDQALVQLLQDLGPTKGHPELSLAMMHSTFPRLRRELYTPLPPSARSPLSSLAMCSNVETAAECMQEVVEQSGQLIKRMTTIRRFTSSHFGH